MVHFMRRSSPDPIAERISALCRDRAPWRPGGQHGGRAEAAQ